jgi:regulator of sirC expression with transglutaminase-like and TPR domain
LEAALVLSESHRLDAGEAGPISLGPYRQQVAAMATDLADLVRRRGAAPDRLGEVIARAYAYRGDRETYDDLQNADLARVIERRKGLPVALAILYLHVARQQGWEAEGLNFPGHFLIRVGIEGARHVVDPFHDGLVRDADQLRDLLRQVLGPQAEPSPAYFDPVPDRDVLLRLENNVRLRLAKREDWPGTARSLERMLAVAPERAELLFEAGEINARLDNRRAAISAFERFLGTMGGPDVRARDPDLHRRALERLQELRRGLN